MEDIRNEFDRVIERNGTGCVKYDGAEKVFGKKGLMPLWVADMDFATPDFILSALKKRLDHPVLGYPETDESYYDSIISWVKRLHGWELSSDEIRFIPGIVRGIGFVLSVFARKGDKVIIQPPVYHPFRLVPEKNGLEVVYNPLVPVYEDGEGKPEDMTGPDCDRILTGYRMDFRHLESIIDGRTKVMILSNPHNPAGIAWDKDTLAKLAEITSRHGILVISDEIHAEMLHGNGKHLPYAMASEQGASNSITFMAPSKTFNIAGVVSSYSIIKNPDISEKFHAFLEADELDSPNIFSSLATVSAYSDGWKWRQHMLDYVWENIVFVDSFLKEHIPSVRALKPSASFLVWLDCRSLRLTQDELVSLFVKDAGLALNDGSIFGKEGTGFMRLNVGCPRSTLHKALSSLKNAMMRRCLI